MMKKHEKFKSMWDISERLGNPEDLIRPNRELLHQGDIKKKDRRGDLSDRYLILFNDLLIEAYYSVVQAYGDSKQAPLTVNHSIELIEVTVEDHPLKDEFPNDFIVKSPKIVRTFVAEHAEAKQEWMEKLQAQIKVPICSACSRTIIFGYLQLFVICNLYDLIFRTVKNDTERLEMLGPLLKSIQIN